MQRPASISTHPVVIAMRVAAYWIEASHSRSRPDFDLRVAARALRSALGHANRAGDAAAKRVAMRYLNMVRSRAAHLAMMAGNHYPAR